VKRLVDGVEVELTPEEEAAVLAEWAANEEFVRVPPEVTMRQARLALLAAGKLAAVDAAINTLPEPDRTAARISWEYSATVQRHQPFVLALAPALGLSEGDLNNLFIQADTL
jgi:hypothetical protein